MWFTFANNEQIILPHPFLAPPRLFSHWKEDPRRVHACSNLYVNLRIHRVIGNLSPRAKRVKRGDLRQAATIFYVYRLFLLEIIFVIFLFLLLLNCKPLGKIYVLQALMRWNRRHAYEFRRLWKRYIITVHIYVHKCENKIYLRQCRSWKNNRQSWTRFGPNDVSRDRDSFMIQHVLRNAKEIVRNDRGSCDKLPRHSMKHYF